MMEASTKQKRNEDAMPQFLLSPGVPAHMHNSRDNLEDTLW